MSRIRTVKPELFRHLALFEAEEKYGLPLRIAFVGLFTCCDRRGRFLWQPRRLKVDILPYDEVDINDVLNALIESGFIKAYEVEGVIYGCIPTWPKHQYFNNKESDSALPDIKQGKILKGPITQSMLAVHARLSATSPSQRTPEFEALSTREICDSEVVIDAAEPSDVLRAPHADITVESDDLLRENHACVTRDSRVSHLMEGKGREWKGREKSKTEIKKNPKHCRVQSPPTADVSAIFAHWQQVMKHPQARLDSSRRQWITSALAMGYSVGDCCQAITGCSLTQHNMGHNAKGERYDGIHIIFKSADQIERFMQNAVSPPRPQGKAEQRLQNNTSVAQAWLESSLTQEEKQDGIR